MEYMENISLTQQPYYVKQKRFYSAYPEIAPDKIRLSWNKKTMMKLDIQGYKYCRRCVAMIMINERTCRVCRKKFAKLPNDYRNRASKAKREYVDLQRSKESKFGSSLLW